MAVEIELSNGMSVLIDDEDEAFARQYRWHAITNKKCNITYAWREKWSDGKRTKIMMHRELMGVGEEEEVDHKNRNGLDNRRNNMRPCTPSQNMANRKTPSSNTSGFRGVQDNHRGGWISMIGMNRRKKYLGTFKTRRDAALAYDCAAQEIYGEFAQLNFAADDAEGE